jgi:DNA modification methylase
MDAEIGADLLSQTGLTTSVEDWLAVPSPKPSSADRAFVGGWVNVYTTFSLRFAEDALRLLTSGRPSVIVDPFVGSGTTLAAARLLGHDAVGVDLDPFSAIVARARVSVRPDVAQVLSAIEAATAITIKVEVPVFPLAAMIFPAHDLWFADAIFKIVEARLGRRIESAFNAILDAPDHSYDTEAVLLASVMVAATRVANVSRGSNPVWLRRTLEGEAVPREPLATASGLAAKRFLDLASRNAKSYRNGQIRVVCGDSRTLDITDASADAVLTSPPYLNRLDYVVSHYPSIALFAGAMGLDVEVMRRRMIGTTKMNDKLDDLTGLGRVCRTVLNSVQEHGSFASRRYYYWTYLQYFHGLRDSISEIGRVLRVGGCGALVIQDSFYKEIRIPASEIVIEMAGSIGLDAMVVREQTVRQHMGRLSPTQTSHVADKVLREYVIYLRK